MNVVRAVTVCLGAGVLAATLGLAKKPGDPAKGKVVFQQCAMCHNSDNADKKMGPGLKGLFHKEKLQNGKRVTEQSVRAQIDDGGSGMPPFKAMLSDQEKEDLLAYLKTL